MYTTEDFAELDKTNFKSYKFPNGNIYYGETALMSPSQTIVTNPEEITDEEEKNALKLVRHGNGVQLYNVQDTKCDCKYEGSWEFDKKKGRGTAYFTDGSTYQGEFDDDLFEGAGKFVWKAGHVYIGNWRKGKMEGTGEFKHKDGHILHGQFINNYMLDKELNIFLDPFLPVEKLEIFRIDNINYQKVLEKERIEEEKRLEEERKLEEQKKLEQQKLDEEKKNEENNEEEKKEEEKKEDKNVADKKK